jgi:hypothetical protein
MIDMILELFRFIENGYLIRSPRQRTGSTSEP